MKVQAYSSTFDTECHFFGHYKTPPFNTSKFGLDWPIVASWKIKPIGVLTGRPTGIFGPELVEFALEGKCTQVPSDLSCFPIFECRVPYYASFLPEPRLLWSSDLTYRNVGCP
jgi:hypothetical protein